MRSPIEFARLLYGTFGRCRARHLNSPTAVRRHRTFGIEPLETRTLLSADLLGSAAWLDQGPGTILNGNNVEIAALNNPQAGAVNAIAADPTNANRMFIGSVGGGIWRTTNATAANPDWTPLTDQYASTAIGSIAFSPLDPTLNTLFAGTGRYSSGGGDGTATIGILKTTDGGNTWSILGQNVMGGLNVMEVIPTSIGTVSTQVVLAATNGGIFRSTDGGANWGATPVLNGNVTSLAADPSNNMRFYAAVPGTGIFLSTDGGQVWNPANGDIPAPIVAQSTFIELAVHNSGATFSVIFNSGVPTIDAFRSVNQGTNWAAMDDPPNIARPRRTSIVADPNDANVVYISGVPGSVTPPGSARPSGRILRGDFAQGAGTQWTWLVGNGANGTSPHPDARWLTFDANGDLLDADDGGVYRLNDTGAGTQSWVSVNGNLRTVEFYSVAYDSNANSSFGGTQDNGTPQQDTPAATPGGAPPTYTWVDRTGADGGFVGVDIITLDALNQSIHYQSEQFLGRFTFSRQVYDANSDFVSSTEILLDVAGAGGADLRNFVNGAFTFDNTVQFIQPWVLNEVVPTRMLIGTNFLYESTNSGDTLTSLGGLNNLNGDGIDNDADAAIDEGDEFTPAGPVGPTRALAYGGRLNGVDNADVIFVGTTGGTVNGAFGTLFRRTTNSTNTLADFTTLANYPGVAPRDIVLDPDNWQQGYLVDSNSQVWRFANGGTALADWTNVTGNLNPPGGSGAAPLSTDLRTIELFTATAASGDDIILVGGAGGTFRTLNPFAGPNAVWTEFGVGLPNAIVKDLHYDAADDLLLAGTWGRGAWTVADAADFLPAAGVLEIFGDEDGFAEDDDILLIREANNPLLLDVFINDVLVLTTQISLVQQINVYTLGGNDTLMVDSTNGLINVPLGIRYDGGSGSDELQLLQTGGPTHATDTYSVGPAIGSGVSTIVGTGTAGTQTVFFEDLEPVLDLVPVALLTIHGTPTGNAINYAAGGGGTGFVTIDEHESIEFANKTALVIEAGAGTDSIGINNPITPAGLTGITIHGGDPGDGDLLMVTGVGVAATVNTATGVITGATGAAGAVSITYTTIELLGLTALGNLTLTTTGADDIVTVTPGLAAGANSGTVQSSGAVPQITFVNSGTLTANLAGGDDELIVDGSTDPDTIAVSGAAVAITGRRTVNVTGTEAIRVNGRAGADTFNVTPSTTVAIFIDGGDPVGVTPGDLLTVIAGGAAVTFNSGPETDEGSLVAGANQPVSFDHIESVAVTGSGPATINGTNGPDAITVIARDASTHAGTDGVQDFTVSINTGPELLFINVVSLTVNALSGSDQVTLQTPAPNAAVWDVDVTVNGGAPAGDTDRLIVQTPAAAAESVTFTPAAADGGTLNLISLSSLVTIVATEALLYDGRTDNDTLTTVGTAAGDVFVHTPGATNDAGTLQVNSLLALVYQNLGSGGALTADGGGGSDTLVAYGTAVNDSFTVGAAGQVNLNSRVVLNVASVETLTLEGLDGNDTFTLVPAISASVYTTMNFNGGAQSSATGDRVFLVATAGDDNINVSGQTVSLGGRTVQSSGMESIGLNALGGDDLLTYDGVSGVTENITIASSGIAGGGQLSAPNVTLVDFSGVERIDVNGNAPTPTETDTLAFAGTNDADVFTINLAADGTDADPILQLETAGVLLLTLRNYINFATLQVQGRDGEDTFNVTVDETGPSRDLFVDGGIPQGKKKSTDNLNIFYVPPRPSIIHSAATQDPDAGLVDLDYDTARFVVQYDGIEQVVIRRLA